MWLLGARQILTHVFMIANSYHLTRHVFREIERKDGRGGVIIIIKNELIAEQITSSMLSEIVAVKTTTHRQPIIIEARYKQPKISDLKQLTTELQDLLLQYKNSPFWVGGDFNLPSIDWLLKSKVKHQYCKEINEVFLESLDAINAEQIVVFPTRGDNALDLLLTNRVSLLNKCRDIPGLGDHQSTILADIECHPKKQKPISRKIYLWKKANHKLLRETIQQNVESFIATNGVRAPVNNLWEKFSFFVSNTQDKYVPSKMSSVRYSKSWFTSHCKKLVRKKKHYQKEKKVN